MAAPTGEEVIYEARAKRSETRLTLDLDYPALPAAKTDTFSTGILDSRDWWHLALAPQPMLCDANGLHFRSWGGPTFEIARTTAHWFPDDPTRAFRFSFGIKFPQADPVYSPIVIVGGLTNAFGDIDDPLMIMQQGSATTLSTAIGDATEGDILVYSGTILTPVHTEANDTLEHTVEVIWDPAKVDNTFTLTIKFDSVIVHEYDGQRPRYMAGGWTWPVLVDKSSSPDNPIEVPALGTIDSPVTIMTITGVSNEQVGAQGYETRTRPSWTTANAGGDIDTAAYGERFVLDGITWAKIHPALYTIDGERARSSLSDTINVELIASDESSNNVFEDNRLVNRLLLLDTRMIRSDDNTTSAWRRQGAFRIIEAEVEADSDGVTVSLDGRADVANKMDTFIDLGFLGELDSSVVEENDFPIDITISEILETIIEVSDALAGSILDTDYLVRSISIKPETISTGGQSLLPVFAELADQTASEFYTTFATSGAERYGSIKAHAWSLGTGVAIYTFSALEGLMPDMSVKISADDAPTQLNYRQNLAIINNNEMVNSKYIPTPGLFPTHPYPQRGKPLIDSLAFAKSLQATGLLVLKDKNDANITGGVAAHRYRLENTRRRVLSFTVTGHDWLEPTDEIAVSGPIVSGSETWIVESISYSWKDGVWTSDIEAVTSDWEDAIRRTL